MSRPLRATYRVQFNTSFTFAAAEALVPYLAELGISHLYASPIFAARPGSTHGYDATDPNRLNPELGTEAAFASLVDALHRAEMGMIVDIVPNHMAVHRSNRMLQEALCLGSGSDAGRVFDIDWNADYVALPFLGGPLESVLAEITLQRDGESGLLMAVYHDHAFALRPATVAELMAKAELDDVAGQWRALEREPRQSAFEDAALATSRLENEEFERLERALASADVASILESQRWRLADWRTASERLNHRRFFNITELIGVRVEDQEVFERTHRLAVELVRKGDVDGLRIDHIDGLKDPEAYCRQLRDAVGPNVPIFVEKILGVHEHMPDWPVDGTTGYERLNEINRLFVDRAGYDALDAHLVEQGALEGDFATRLVSAKRQVLHELFAPEIDSLASRARALGGDLDEARLRAGLEALLVHFPVYRSYVSDRGWSAGDEAAWNEALDRARQHEPEDTAEAAAGIYDSLRRGGEAALDVVVRFQQLSGPAMAKGLEDTELYRSAALTSVNEVGSEPDAAASTPEEAHAAVRQRMEGGDRSLIPMATHDTKRGPDTRARINVLSYDPRGWVDAFERWYAMAAPLRQAGAPDRLDEWLIYQTVVGAWPIDEDRLIQYIEKAMREAKRHTRWEDPAGDYEEPVRRFSTGLLASDDGAALRREIEAFVARIDVASRVNGIAQTILQLTLPGVPDIYQGTELWDRSLVDPDNRRPVDWRLRQRLLAEQPLPAVADDGEGTLKMRITATLLGLRRRLPELFLEGSYEPLAEAGGRVFSFLRRHRGTTLLVAVPLRGGHEPVRLPSDLADGLWQDLVADEPVRIESTMTLPPERPFLVMYHGV